VNSSVTSKEVAPLPFSRSASLRSLAHILGLESEGYFAVDTIAKKILSSAAHLTVDPEAVGDELCVQRILLIVCASLQDVRACALLLIEQCTKLLRTYSDARAKSDATAAAEAAVSFVVGI
jgi:hypothetical protein